MTSKSRIICILHGYLLDIDNSLISAYVLRQFLEVSIKFGRTTSTVLHG